MEGVYHIYVIKIRRGCLISKVHGMLERYVPDGEGLVLRITCLDPALEFMIKLG